MVDVPKLVDKKGNSTTSHQEISQKFNYYFSNIAENLKSKIQNKHTHTHTHSLNQREFIQSMGPELHNSIFLNPVDPSEVSEIIKFLKNKTTLDTKISA